MSGAEGTGWFDVVLVVWFALSALSAMYVAWDAFTKSRELAVMKWAWILVTLFLGLIGAALYVLSCKGQRAVTHEAFVRPAWKQALGSTIHCVAGDTTGIIAAAVVTNALGLPMWLDVLVEYGLGFGFGLLIFQALFTRSMYGGSYGTALRRSFLPEWLSMNAMMAVMIPTMVILMSRDAAAMQPTSLRFWGVMSLGTLVSAIVAYPVNWWLVSVGLKHGMGTVAEIAPGGTLALPDAGGQQARAAAPPDAETVAHRGGVTQSGRPVADDHDAVAALAVTGPQLAAVGLLSLLALAGGVVVAALFGDFSMRAGGHSPAGSPDARPAPAAQHPRHAHGPPARHAGCDVGTRVALNSAGALRRSFPHSTGVFPCSIDPS